MIYRIKEGMKNDILHSDIIVTSFEDLTYDNYENFITNMVCEYEIFKFINFPKYIIDLILDIVINDKTIDYLKDELTKNKVPLYSLIIGVVNNYKIKYNKLLKLKEAEYIEIVCNKDNLIRGLEFAKKFKCRIIIDGSNISLGDYQRILFNYDISSLDIYDIKVNYQEHNSEIGIRELYDTATIVNNISNEIKKYNLSPLEKIIYVYDIVKKRVYRKSDEISSSRDLDKVIKGEYIVCVGYSNLFNAILRNLNINAKPLVSLKIKHQRSMVYIKDDKYNIDGVYVFDPTWDSKKNESYLKNYSYFGLTINNSEIDAPSIIFSDNDFSIDRVLKTYDEDYFFKNANMYSTLEELFKFIGLDNFNEFGEIVKEYEYTNSEKRKRLYEIYDIFLSKYNVKDISIYSFFKSLYNVRLLEYYNGMIDNINIDDIKSAVRGRCINQVVNYSRKKNVYDRLIESLDCNIKTSYAVENITRNIDDERRNLNVRLLKVLRNIQK